VRTTSDTDVTYAYSCFSITETNDDDDENRECTDGPIAKTTTDERDYGTATWTVTTELKVRRRAARLRSETNAAARGRTNTTAWIRTATNSTRDASTNM
jgi:predicted secreted Zn-dependent protease